MAPAGSSSTASPDRSPGGSRPADGDLRSHAAAPGRRAGPRLTGRADGSFAARGTLRSQRIGPEGLDADPRRRRRRRRQLRSSRSPPSATSSRRWSSPTTTPARAERAVARFQRAIPGSSPPASTRRAPTTSPRSAREHRDHPRPQRGRPALRHAHLRRARFAAGADYLDMAMSLSHPHPERPYERTGVKLGDEQFAQADAWSAAGRLALVGVGVEPGLSDVFARYAARTTCSARSTRSASATARTSSSTATTSRRRSRSGRRSRSASTRRSSGRRDRGWYTTPPFSEPEVVRLPRGDRAGRVRQRRARGGPPRPALGQGASG